MVVCAYVTPLINTPDKFDIRMTCHCEVTAHSLNGCYNVAFVALTSDF